MSTFRIDKQKCNRDGICVEECPSRVIEMTSQDAYPTPTEFFEELCIQCGHCVAVCPKGAFSQPTMKPEECPPVRKKLLVSAEHVEQMIRSRRSIRAYKKKSIKRDILEHLIDIARYSPSGANTQPVNWMVVETLEEVNRMAAIVVDWMQSMLEGKNEAKFPQLLMKNIVDDWNQGIDRICRGALHIIIAHAQKDLRPSLPACIIALANLEIAAPPFGLGACWAGYLNIAANSYEPMFKALGLPNNHQSFGAMMIGYPKYQYHRIPGRKKAVIAWR